MQLKWPKIIGGLFLLFAFSKGYIDMSMELGTFVNIGTFLIPLCLLPLCAWLIGSGLSSEKLPLRSWKFLQYYAGCFLLSLMIAVYAKTTFKFKPDIVTINNVKMDIAEMMAGTRQAIPDANQRRAYCVCLAGKLTLDSDLVARHRADLEAGHLAELLRQLQESPDVEKYKLYECVAAVTTIAWTPEVEANLRAGLIRQMKDNGIAATNDTTQYCNCLIEHYKQIPFQQFSNPDYGRSKDYHRIDSLCDAKSRFLKK